MKFNIRKENEITIIKPEGDMDYKQLDEFSSIVGHTILDGNTKVILNFINVKYFNSAGIRMLINNGKLMNSKGGALVFCSVGSQLRELFEIVELDKIFTSYLDESDAIDKMKQ